MSSSSTDKKQSLLTTLLLFGVAIVAAVIWLKNNAFEERKTDTENKPAFLELNRATLHRFDETGKEKITLTAKKVFDYQDERGREFFSPVLVRKNAANKNQLEADFARENEAETELDLEKVRAKSINQKGEENLITTDTAKYFIAENRVETDKYLEIQTPKSKTTATGGEWLVGDNMFILKKNIRSAYAQKTK